MLALHRSRCIDWRPKPIVALATTTETTRTTAHSKVVGENNNDISRENGQAGHERDVVGTTSSSTRGKDANLLALARESGRIEVWKRNARQANSSPGSWYKILDIPGLKTVVCKCLAWVKLGEKLRLIGGSLEGNLIEIDLDERKPKKLSMDASGSGIWSMKAVSFDSGTRLLGCTSLIACACDDGALRIFGMEIGSGECNLVQTYPNANCRLLSVAWYKDRFVVMGGSDGYLSYRDIVSRKEIFSINGKLERNLNINIWSIDVLENGDIVTGDSSGSVRIWDGKFGSLLKSFPVHKRDVLAVVAHKSKIFSTGVDGQINMLAHEGKGPMQWGLKGKKRPHSHDVMSLALSENTLFSGGNDTRLLAYDADAFLERHPTNLQAYGEVPQIQVTAGVGNESLMICQQLDAVEIWQITTLDQDRNVKAKLSKGKEGEPLEAKVSPKLLAVLSSSSNVFCSALSPDRKYVAYSNMTSLHLYSLFDSKGGKGLGVKKLRSERALLRNIQFTPNGKFVLGVNLANECCIHDASTLELLHVFPNQSSSRSKLAFPVDELLTVSSNSEYVAVTSQRSAVLVFKLGDKSLHAILNVENIITSLCFNGKSDCLLLGTVNQQILFFDLKTCALRKELVGHGQQVAKRLSFISGSIQHISCLGGKEDTYVMLNTIRGLCFVNFGKPTKDLKGKDSQHSRKRRYNRDLQLAAREGQNPRIVPLEDPCLFACFLGQQSALIVECPWLKALRDVRQPLHRKVYGLF